MRRTLSYTEGDGIGRIEFTRSEKLNPLDLAAGEELNELLDELSENKGIRCLVITGTGRAFSAGGDIKGMKQSVEEGTPGGFMDDLTRSLYDICLKLRRFPVPVIGAVNGHAVGAGMNLALSCDFIIASEEASFSQGFAKLALIPGFGGTHLLAMQLPWQKACEIAMLADPISPGEMARLGLVNRVTGASQFEEETMKLARRLAAGPTLSFRRTKELFLKAGGRSLDEHLEEERGLQVRSAESEDYAEGVRALLAKEKPEFSGK